MSPDNITYLIELIKSIFEHFLLKVVLSAITVAYGFFFDPGQTQALSALLFLLIADFITGVAAAYYQGHAIKSAKVLRSAIKVAVYFLLVACAHVSEYAVAFTLLDETVIGFLVVTELVSIMENIGKMGYVVPKKLLNVLKEYRDGK